MAAAAARRSGGRITEVFEGAERQAAYDFLEHSQVEAELVRKALSEACWRRCRGFPFVYVVLDGTSLTLTDERCAKGFGSIGTRLKGARGLKVLNSLALDPQGVPLGIPTQQWWARKTKAKAGYRPLADRESAHWRHAVTASDEFRRKLAPETRMHFLADREADASELIRHMLEGGHAFTIRSNATRKVWIDGESRPLRSELIRSKPRATLYVDVPRTAKRPARRAKLVIRGERYVVILRDHHLQQCRRVELNVVWAREHGTCPRSQTPLSWFLYTNVDIGTPAHLCAVVQGYTKRWRIEDFHRTWKNGHCRVEDTQLRSVGAVVKWATIHAAVATRAERLRRRARETPDAPASVELTGSEIDALLLLKRRHKRRNESIPDTGTPSLQNAVRWIADLGGYVGNRSSGPPGATTIARGLERVVVMAEAVDTLREAGRLR